MNVLITGVSRGIGKELLSLAISSDKVQKIFACTSSKMNTESTNRVKYCNLDFSNDSTLLELQILIAKEEINVVINNAGFLHQELYKDMNILDAQKMFDVNFWGPFKLIKILLPNLKAGKGHVVNIGSMGGFQGSGKFPGLAAYSASKAALANLTECLAEEHKEDGVTFNCLALGAVDTEMLKKAFPEYHAGVSARSMADYILNFSLFSGSVVKGKVLPVSSSNP